MKLNEKPARFDLTDRECAKLLGGMIGSLLHMADANDVRAAVRWWAARKPETWREMGASARQIRAMAEDRQS